MNFLNKVNSKPSTTVGDLVARVISLGNAKAYGNGFQATQQVALESLDTGKSADPELQRTASDLAALLQTVALESQSENKSSPFSPSQIAAGTVAAMLSGDIRGTAARVDARVDVAGAMVAADATARVGLEAYDERSTRDAAVYTTVYNMQASRQDAFGEAFYPTVVVSPEQVGFTTAVNLITVMDDLVRNAKGDAQDFKRRNIIDAARDSTVLETNTTKLVPVYNTDTAKYFVATADVASSIVTVDGNDITTGPLLMGATMGLLNVTQTAALLATGQMDVTDMLDVAIFLKALYVKVTVGSDHEVVRLDTLRLSGANFTYAPQGNKYDMQLSFHSKQLMINPTTRNYANGALVALAPLVTANHTVRLEVRINGTVNLETSELYIGASAVSVVSVSDAAGNSLSLTTGAGQTTKNLFTTSAVVGYDLDGQRTNSNRRQRGKLLNTMVQYQAYAVPLLSPITIPRPHTTDNATDAPDLAALITATRIRTSNAAVTELLKARDQLAGWVGAGIGVYDTPEVLGIARWLVDPFYETNALDVSDAINNLSSKDVVENIRAVLVTAVRDQVYRAYATTGYKVALEVLNGAGKKPTVIIGCDPELEQYLFVEGDMRLMGSQFNVVVVSSTNNAMTGRIIWSFGDADAAAAGTPGVLHFGCMAWKPEQSLVLPIHRQGANSRELTVQPSFRHVTNLPIMGQVTVTGLPTIAEDGTPIKWHQV